MGKDLHLRSDHYALTRAGQLERESFVRHLHSHLVDACPECGEEWRLMSPGDRRRVEELLAEAAEAISLGDAPGETLPLNQRPAFSWEARQLEAEVQQVRAVLSAAGKKCWPLLQVPRDGRPEKVATARTRYQSRSEAEYLLDKAREVIRRDPREAASLASLVPLVLGRIPAENRASWTLELAVRARAWQANALRVAGDLAAADHRFALLRRDLVDVPLDDRSVLAELASLEASLRIDQRRCPEAHALLSLALAIYESLGDRIACTKVHIQQGNLWIQDDDPVKALESFEAALMNLPEDGDPTLHFGAVNGQVSSLCSLGSWTAAEELLDRSLDLYEVSDDLHAGALVRHHRGRIAMGMGNHAAAHEHLLDARNAFLAVGRTYDALVATLDLASLLAVTGRHRQVVPLARQLVPLFRARGVPREGLAVLKLLVSAAREGAITDEVLDRMRARLRRLPGLRE